MKEKPNISREPLYDLGYYYCSTMEQRSLLSWNSYTCEFRQVRSPEVHENLGKSRSKISDYLFTYAPSYEFMQQFIVKTLTLIKIRKLFF